MAFPVTVEATDLIQALSYDASNNLEYIGLAVGGSAKSAAAWQIKNLLYDASNNLTDVLLANGSREFNQIWDDRAILSYS